MSELELLVRREGGRTLLLCPGVGLFTAPTRRGALLSAGDEAGVLVCLGLARALRVPHGVAGRVENAPRERVHEPVGHGDVLYELAPLANEAVAREAAGAAARSGALVFASPSAGRFWTRPTPADPPFVQVGAELREGHALGLLEVMKTFTRVVYRAEGGLPPRAKVARVLVADGAEVAQGEALLELAP